jgi:hypothetical protein
LNKTVALVMVVAAFVLGLLTGRFLFPRSVTDSSQAVASGKQTTSLSSDRACSIANDFLIKRGARTREPCKNFLPNGPQAQICVGEMTVVALQYYPEEGWKALDVMLGAGCE